MPLILAGLFLGTLPAAALAGSVPPMIVALYGLASLATFIAYALDKSAAQQNRRRIRESTLHLFSVAGGWPGALIAQQALRHKTRKQPFKTIFWFIVAVNCCLLAAYLTAHLSEAVG